MLAAVALTAGRAGATVIFQDNFDANTPSLNGVPIGWTVTNGTVDIVGGGNFGNLCTDQGGSPSPAVCIDLDGSTNQAGNLISPNIFLPSAGSYSVSFWLSGNDRGGSDTMHAGVLVPPGPVYVNEFDQTLSAFTPWALYSYNLTAGGPVNLQLQFHNDGGDNIGILLDNVRVSSNDQAVPEPMSLALLGSGLIGVGAIRRRRMNR